MPLDNHHWTTEEDLKLLNGKSSKTFMINTVFYVLDFFDHRNKNAPDIMIKWEDVFDEDRGFFIEADLSFPENIKEKLEEFPPAPHHCTFSKEEVSQYARDLLEAENLNFSPQRKLCLTLLDKKVFQEII